MTTAELRAVARDTIAIYERIVAHRERLEEAHVLPPRAIWPLTIYPHEVAAGQRAELARAYLALTEPRCPVCGWPDDHAYYNTPGAERDAPCPTCRGNGVTA